MSRDVITDTIINRGAVCITGASSGLGAALAQTYARKGRHLILFGRSEKRLSDCAETCLALGATGVTLQALDIRDREAMAKALTLCDQETPISLLIANAGISGGTAGGGEEAQQIYDIFDINVTGILNSITPILPLMTARGYGQIGLVSSLAGYRGLAGAPAYSASKAAVRTYAEALRGAYRAKGVAVNAICPGFIRTPLTDQNTFKMPFLLEAEDAADRIVKGLEADKPVIAFPWPLHWAVSLFSMLPARIAGVILRALPEKG